MVLIPNQKHLYHWQHNPEENNMTVISTQALTGTQHVSYQSLLTFIATIKSRYVDIRTETLKISKFQLYNKLCQLLTIPKLLLHLTGMTLV